MPILCFSDTILLKKQFQKSESYDKYFYKGTQDRHFSISSKFRFAQEFLVNGYWKER